LKGIILVSIAICVSAGLLTGCGGGNQREYPSTVRENFLNLCLLTSGGQQKNCSCALNEVQKEFDLEEFVKLEIQMTNTGQLPEELAGVIAKCLK